MKNTVYLFDVDGTLTPARQKMLPDFAEFFEQFVKDHPVYLVTGSDMPKVQAQLPSSILAGCEGVFVCSGAEFWQDGVCTEKRDHRFPSAMIDMVQTVIDQSPYLLRAGNHIEPRTGMINVSIVGRNAKPEQRLAYFEWDKMAGERRAFAKQLSDAFPDYEITLGGQISLDIVPKGLNKSIVKDVVLARHMGAALCFYGDRMDAGGNDKPLADALIAAGAPHRAITIKNYQETWESLKAECGYLQ